MKKILHQLRHFLLPHESNNHRPKLLHEHTLLVLIFAIICSTFILKSIHKSYPSVLGIQANISTEELLKLTNEKRAKEGLKPLKMNEKLAIAANEKAKYMFDKNFWAHIGPDGTTPWFFIRNAKYEYLYAGENLARGYTTAPEVVDAWMASPTHRENIMSPNYSDIGFAVATGKLTGSETVLVVEMFGTEMSSNGGQIASADASSSATAQAPVSAQSPPRVVAQAQTVASPVSEPLLDSNAITQQVGLSLLALFIAVLLVDALIIERKRIVRVVAHNLDHIAFLLLLLFAVMILERGHIL